ncbi:MAG: ATP-binding cassette domain-containing protein [candidate division Zixibacteria bacterium]|nr:ATP-binding cassette domain-containing protein [candidate division Zixibacteria bacterium]
MRETVIKINGLSKSYGDIPAVRGLDLEVFSGEMLAVVGPDGAGKTTTIRILCGILDPDEGRVDILGHDLRREIEDIKPDIGYLSQSFSLYGDLSIDENIEFFADIHRVKDFKERREELLEFTRLTGFRKRLADRLSGGMKQKLALACTLIHRPRIIFLDEPTTGVDPVSRRDFWKILADLLNEGITIIMTTPYLDEAERCTRVGLMNEGSLMVVDTPMKVKAMMKGNVVEIVCDKVRQAFFGLKDLKIVREVQAFGDRLNIVVENIEEDTSRAINKLKEMGIEVSDWRRVNPSLENVFISMIKSG